MKNVVRHRKILINAKRKRTFLFIALKFSVFTFIAFLLTSSVQKCVSMITFHYAFGGSFWKNIFKALFILMKSMRTLQRLLCRMKRVCWVCVQSRPKVITVTWISISTVRQIMPNKLVLLCSNISNPVQWTRTVGIRKRSYLLMSSPFGRGGFWLRLYSLIVFQGLAMSFCYFFCTLKENCHRSIILCSSGPIMFRKNFKERSSFDEYYLLFCISAQKIISLLKMDTYFCCTLFVNKHYWCKYPCFL